MNKVALVTGGTSGLGLQLISKLIERRKGTEYCQIKGT